MLLKTILNQVENHKSFVYCSCRFVDAGCEKQIEIDVRPRKNNKAICSGCKQPRPGYDKLSPRRFEYVPLWGIAIFFIYIMRRVDCPTCGVTVEEVPWAQGKSPLTKSFSLFLAIWARPLPWQEVARIFGTTWNRVYDAVKWVVAYGRDHQNLEGITAIGVDEVSRRKGQKYMTLVYQINSECRRLLWIGKDRTEESFRGFFDFLGEDRSLKILFACSDMWKPYLNVIREKASNAINILDRFHIMANMGKALEEIRREEVHHLRGRAASQKRTMVYFEASGKFNRQSVLKAQRLACDESKDSPSLYPKGRISTILGIYLPC